MRLGILSRLILGNVILLVIAVNMGLYAVVELGRVSDNTRSIILVDTALVSQHKKLTDALLSETNFEKKYLIIRDLELYEVFLRAKGEFERAVDEARRIDLSDDAMSALNNAADLHRSYAGLFRDEVGFLTRDRPYERSWYASEKDRAVTAAMGELARLRQIGRADTLARIKELSDAGEKARTLGMIVGAATLLLGLVLSVLITRSITRPLAAMREKTKDIACGIFEADLRISSPPEIGALAEAFNTMCRKLREVDRTKCEFFSLMSHELRTPLASIREGTNLLLEGRAGEVSDRQKRLVTIISEESNRLIDLVNSILDLSKIEAGMMAFRFTRAGLAPLIARVVAEVGPLVEAKRIRMSAKTDDLPPLSMDVERMLQVLRNLVGNALKFTPPQGAISISARRSDESLLVSVSDSGPGIPREHQELIFDKFRQAPVSGRPAGTGLGLAIVREIVQVHGGTVWVHSEGENGSTFFVRLPASPGPAAPQPPK